jgi:surface protein
VFAGAPALTQQDIGRWDVSTVTNMGHSKCPPFSPTFFFPLASTFGRGCVCKGRGSHDDGPTAPVLSRDPLLTTPHASFFCWCGGVLCVACGACGTCAVFGSAAFNQDIGRWDVSAVITMDSSKCPPSLARSFSSWIDPRGDCVCKGRVPRRRPTDPQSFHVPRHRAPLVFTCRAHFPLRIRSKTFFEL